MSINHKPATPLPWDFHTTVETITTYTGHTRTVSEIPTLNTRTFLIEGEGDNQGAPIADEEDNFVYIAHAANAYPRLVEALRDLSAWCALATKGELTELSPARQAALTLLRSLGEEA